MYVARKLLLLICLLPAVCTADLEILRYHDGTPVTYWQQEYVEGTWELASDMLHVWCGPDPYVEGENPHFAGCWLIEKIRIFHYGEGDFLLKVFSAEVDEYSSYQAGHCWDLYEYEFSTQCSDCWEEFELNCLIDCTGGCCGQFVTGVMPVICFIGQSEDDGGFITPRLGIGTAADEPGGTVHPHPYSSMMGTGMAGGYWHDLADKGDYLVDIYWRSGGQTSAEETNFSSVKTQY